MSLLHYLRFGSFGHDFQNSRDPLGRLTRRCTSCGFTRLVLCEDVVKGPAHQQVPDLGMPKGKAKVVRPDNVREFRQSER